MKLRVGYDMSYDCAQDTPMILSLHIHDSRAADIIEAQQLTVEPPVAVTHFRDFYGNPCSRLVAPAGRVRLRNHALLTDSGLPDEIAPDAEQSVVEDLPVETLPYLLGSRYCETDRLSDIAWNLFGSTPPGWARVQAICDWVHNHIRFGYEHARATKTALDAYNEGCGVCRDYAHLAIAFCRCMNIPTRYATGYLPDIRVPPADAPMDFAAWFEVWLGGQWHTFDARNNTPRIGRVLMARGRDAADCSLVNSFGAHTLVTFEVIAEEVA